MKGLKEDYKERKKLEDLQQADKIKFYREI